METFPRHHRIAASIAIFLQPVLAGAEVFPESIAADLDGDGVAEKIVWEKFAETEDEGAFFQIRVVNADGSLRWEGPRTTDSTHPMALGDWFHGTSLPQVAADFDGDGAVELIVPAPQTDVSPTQFRVFRWTGQAFLPLHMAALMDRGGGDGEFPWYEGDDYEGTWISGFLGVAGNRRFRVVVSSYDGRDAVRHGEAIVSSSLAGVRVSEWTVPLNPGPGEPAMAGAAMVYRARLSAADHRNSAGTVLKTARAILRQDRANFHGGRGDREDGPDPVFVRREARELMERLPISSAGMDESAWADMIVRGTPLVEVTITNSGLVVRILD